MAIYKYDIHTHTSEVSPCGKVEAEKVVELYKEAGYTGIVITDHYYEGFFENISSSYWEEKTEIFLSGYKRALSKGLSLGLNVILGLEIRFIDGPEDYLIYGVNEEFLIENPELYNLNLMEFRNMVKDKGMLIYQAHPFRPGLVVQEPKLLDGIEVYNGNPRHDSKNDLAYSFAINNGLKMISGSDFHQVMDLARGGIIVKENISTSKELVEVLESNDGVELIMDDIIQFE